jgi:hypothetical protein
LNAENSDMCNTYSAIRPYVKDNQPLQSIKSRPYFMVDSTYTVAADPNTMRDNGPLRNAQYYVKDQVQDKVEKSMRDT